MSKISHLPKTLPPKELPFEFQGIGDLSGHKYSGSFVVRVPTNRDLLSIGTENARLANGVSMELLENGAAVFNRAIAFLKVCLIDAPAWFINSPDHPNEEGISYGLDSYDINIPIEIFKLAEEKVQGWHNTLKGSKNDSAKKGI